MEVYANTRDEKFWKKVADMTLGFVRSGFWGVAWSKGGGGFRYSKFAYGTFLMAFEPDSRLLFGGSFGGIKSKPQKLFYWDLGDPLQRFQKIDEARHPEFEGIYQRDFTKGKVLVNPTLLKSGVVRLERGYYDPGMDAEVKEIQIEPLTAAILLTPAAE